MIGRRAYVSQLSLVLSLLTNTILSYPQKHIPYPTLVEKQDGFSRTPTNLTSSNATGSMGNAKTANGPDQGKPIITQPITLQDDVESEWTERPPTSPSASAPATSQSNRPPPVPPRPSEAILAPVEHPQGPKDQISDPQIANQPPAMDSEIMKLLPETAEASNTSAIQEDTQQAGQEKVATGYEAGETESTVPDKADAGSTIIDPFQPVATAPPPSLFPLRGDHPVARKNIRPQSAPLQTNKFYANLYLGGQNNAVFLHPYSVAWSKGSGPAQSWGLAVSHIEASQRTFGPGNPARYYINPLGIQSLVLSAAELGQSTSLTTDSLTPYSINANLVPNPDSSSSIRFPLLQGSGFFTAIYNKLLPLIQTGVFFRSVTFAGSPRVGIFKYHITLEDGKQWLMYVIPNDQAQPGFTLVSNTLLKGPTSAWSGVIQVAKNPDGRTGEALFDAAAGMYPTTASLSGNVTGNKGTYTMKWVKAGLLTNMPLLMYALTHHLPSFDSGTSKGVTRIVLDTTTKGPATAVIADQWTMIEPNLPTELGFGPWNPNSKGKDMLSVSGAKAVHAAAQSEITQPFDPQTDVNSMYYSGKALSKFAVLVWALQNIAGDAELAKQGLQRLQSSFGLFTQNKQQFPLVYDTAWKGIVSSATYKTGDVGADFGNSLYNDHHFHWGYHIHAAAVIGSMDKAWLAQNKDWVNTLVRDAGNPSGRDNYFPVSRAFDWYHGHSWAKGLFDSGDSKDEESTTEDAMFAYAIKLWGRVIGDASMEARGNLMLAVLARSINTYFFMTKANTVQPANFIGNKVTGITFENKIDYTTYFGNAPEYIHGIHIIPPMPFTPLIRPKQFVQEEWDAFFKPGAVADADKVTGGWQGLLKANQALIDPKASFDFFNASKFDSGSLDGGATKTWYLALAAAYGGA